MRVGAALLLAIALGAPAAAQEDVLADPPLPGQGAFQTVLDGLAAELVAASEALRAGERHVATRALDRSLHLAEFGSHAFALGERQRAPFETAHQEIKKARHALQNGRAKAAAGTLSTAGYTLKGSVIEPARSRIADRTAAVEGLPVLNSRGHRLGELESFESREQGLRAVVSHGGFLGIEADQTIVPAGALLGSTGFVVLPVAIEPNAFRAMAELKLGP